MASISTFLGTGLLKIASCYKEKFLFASCSDRFIMAREMLPQEVLIQLEATS